MREHSALEVIFKMGLPYTTHELHFSEHRYHLSLLMSGQQYRVRRDQKWRRSNKVFQAFLHSLNNPIEPCFHIIRLQKFFMNFEEDIKFKKLHYYCQVLKGLSAPGLISMSSQTRINVYTFFKYLQYCQFYEVLCSSLFFSRNVLDECTVIL